MARLPVVGPVGQTATNASGTTPSGAPGKLPVVGDQGPVDSLARGMAQDKSKETGPILWFGLDGENGLDGWIIPGPAGLAGAPGGAGAAGATGAIGPQGPPGLGLDGLDGLDGQPIPGPIGPTGLTGSIGPAGPAGFGFSLDGEDGQDGVPMPGIPGPAGPTGPIGATGPAGIIGFSLDGMDGEDSFPIPGAAGPAGATGATGAAGSITRPSVVQVNGSIANNFNVTMSSTPTVGNLLVAICTHWNSLSAAGTGWNLFYNIPGGTNDGMGVAFKVANSADTTALVPFIGGVGGSSVIIYEISGALAIAPLNIVTAKEVAISPYSVKISGSRSNSLLIGGIFEAGANTDFTVATYTTDLNITGTTSSNSPRRTQAIHLNTNAATSGDISFTFASGSWAGYILELFGG